MKTLLTFVGATILSSSVNAQTVTIDFEEWNEYTIISSFTTKGYQFVSDGASTVIHSHDIIELGYGYDYGWSNSGTESVGAIITREDGGAFSLLQFDAASYESGGSNIYTDYLAIGTRASDGSQISYVFDANEGLFTYAPIGFGSLSSLVFYSPARIDGVAAGFHMDNIVLTAVPVPLSLWLFGSGLVCLLGLVKRK